MGVAVALLLFPGLAFALACGLLLAALSGDVPRWGGGRLGAEAAAGLASVALAALGLALAPLPLSPLAGSAPAGNVALAWALLEGSFLAPLVLPLASRQAAAVRSASRAAQMGGAGRAVVWLSAGACAWAGAAPAELPGRALLLAAALLALPAAGGLGPFGAERSLVPGGLEDGLDDLTRALLRYAAHVRAAALAATAAAAALPLGGLGPAGLAGALAAVAGLGLALRWAAALPRLTLPGALRWCWLRALPLAIAGMAYLIIV